MIIFSRLPFSKHMLFANKIARMYLPKKHIRTRVRGRQGMKLAPENIMDTPRESKMLTGFAKSCAFTAAFGCAAFIGASIWQYENRKSLYKSRLSPAWMKAKVRSHYKEYEWRKFLNSWWNKLAESEKVYCGIVCLNVIVFCGWKFSPLMPFMMRNFCSSPAYKAVCMPLLLSSFSHFNFVHIAANMIALYGFSKTVGSQLGKEQFVGFYLFASVFSGLIGNGLKIARGMIGPSLGASGAIMAVLGYFCVAFPEAKISILFLPMFDFSASFMLKAIMTLDTAGIVLGWRLFDHAAHLGGATFGVFYAYFGYHLWQKRHIVIKKWKELME